MQKTLPLPSHVLTAVHPHHAHFLQALFFSRDLETADIFAYFCVFMLPHRGSGPLELVPKRLQTVSSLVMCVSMLNSNFCGCQLSSCHIYLHLDLYDSWMGALCIKNTRKDFTQNKSWMPPPRRKGYQARAISYSICHIFILTIQAGDECILLCQISVSQSVGKCSVHRHIPPEAQGTECSRQGTERS